MANSIPVLDEQMLIDLIGEDADEIKSIYADFMDDVKSALPKLANAARENDSVSLRQVAHYLKTSSSGVGAMRLTELLSDIEIKSANPESDDFRRCIFRLKDEVVAVKEAIQHLISKYQ